MAANKITLTPKQEKFCQNVGIKKMTYSDAYRNSYNAGNMMDKTINERASELMADSKISERVKELSGKSTEAVIKEAVYDYKVHMEELEMILTKSLNLSGEDTKLMNTALKAIELKGKVSELYNFVQKQEVTQLSPEEFYEQVDKKDG